MACREQTKYVHMYSTYMLYVLKAFCGSLDLVVFQFILQSTGNLHIESLGTLGLHEKVSTEIFHGLADRGAYCRKRSLVKQSVVYCRRLNTNILEPGNYSGTALEKVAFFFGHSFSI